MDQKNKNKGGRPKKSKTQKMIDHMVKVANKYSKDKGKHLDEVLMDLIYDEVATPRDRLAAIKVFKEFIHFRNFSHILFKIG